MIVDIFCPSGNISGGPEALHQLCGALRARDVDAAMVYFGAGGTPDIPSEYAYCGAAVRGRPADGPGALAVVPEVATGLLWRLSHARKAVWWLSVDNFFKWRHLNPGPSVLAAVPGLMHLCQSAYAYDFLALAGAAPLLMLTDYLTPNAFEDGSHAHRLQAVAYNPKKPPPALQRLIGASSGNPWVRLEGLGRPALADLLREVRVYADFGPHPGRDRLPREAALCGAVVITGRRGAAAYAADVPLPDRFRLDEAAADFELKAHELLDCLLRDEDTFLAAWGEQQSYRNWVRANPDAFAGEVDALIATLAADAAEPA